MSVLLNSSQLYTVDTLITRIAYLEADLTLIKVLEHINKYHPNIQFTVEVERDNLSSNKYKINLIRVLVYRAFNIYSSNNFHNEIITIKKYSQRLMFSLFPCRPY